VADAAIVKSQVSVRIGERRQSVVERSRDTLANDWRLRQRFLK
jgi:hypothetical protein